MKSILFIKNLFVITFLLLLVGCAVRQDTEIPKAVFDKPSSIVVTQISGLERPVYSHGSEGSTIGLIPAILSDVLTSSGREQIQSIDAKPIVEEYYYQSFATSFEKRNFKIIRDPSILKLEELAEPSPDDDKHAHFDFRFLKDKFGAEYALVLQPECFGAVRHGIFYNPRATTTLRVYLVNTQNNLLMGYYRASVTMKADNDWDKAPEYKSFVWVTKEALKKALQQAHTYFFNGGLKAIENQLE